MKNNIFKKLFPYLMKYKFVFIFLIIIAIIGNLLTLVGPYLVGKGINEIHFHMEKANYIQLGKISILLLLVSIGCINLNSNRLGISIFFLYAS